MTQRELGKRRREGSTMYEYCWVMTRASLVFIG